MLVLKLTPPGGLDRRQWPRSDHERVTSRRFPPLRWTISRMRNSLLAVLMSAAMIVGCGRSSDVSQVSTSGTSVRAVDGSFTMVPPQGWRDVTPLNEQLDAKRFPETGRLELSTKAPDASDRSQAPTIVVDWTTSHFDHGCCFTPTVLRTYELALDGIKVTGHVEVVSGERTDGLDEFRRTAPDGRTQVFAVFLSEPAGADPSAEAAFEESLRTWHWTSRP